MTNTRSKIPINDTVLSIQKCLDINHMRSEEYSKKQKHISLVDLLIRITRLSIRRRKAEEIYDILPLRTEIIDIHQLKFNIHLNFGPRTAKINVEFYEQNICTLLRSDFSTEKNLVMIKEAVGRESS